MNRKLGIIGSWVNLVSVAAFALSMVLGSAFASYVASMGIALGYVCMASAFCAQARPDARAVGAAGLAFAGVYATLIVVVYFTQLTAVRQGGLSEAALQVLDYSRFGLFFALDLLGYGMMALSTFLIGLTLQPQTRGGRWLKALLLIHGVFFVSCLVMPVLGVFSPDMVGADWVGVVVLEFWCAYFLPVGALAVVHFRRAG